MRHALLSVLLLCAAMLQPSVLPAEQLSVRNPEGLVHGFLTVRTLDGDLIGDGELSQVARGDRVTIHLILHFKDGSLHDETTVYSQRGKLRLLTDHVIQKGPSFKRSTDSTIDASTGQVTVRYAEENGKEKLVTERLELAPDLANGMIFTLLKNLPPTAKQATFSMVAATPKLRIVKLVVTPQKKESFAIGNSSYQATQYDLKIGIAGAAGFVAPLIGKQPPDIHIWILDGAAPAFVKSEGPLFEGGPIWRIELASPVWSR